MSKMKIDMKNKIIQYLKFPLLILLIFLGWKYIFYLFPQDDKESCDVVKIQIKGIVTGVGGHGSYQWIEVNNLKHSIMPGFSDIKYVNGLSDSYIDYQPGDSIIKERNSKEMTIKRKNKYGIYIINCD